MIRVIKEAEIKMQKFRYNKKLTDNLIGYLERLDPNEKLETKPAETFYTLVQDKYDLHKENIETLNRDYATQLDKQLDILSKNIAIKFFELNDEKFQAVMKRIKLWRI
jgi:hypothetical protein